MKQILFTLILTISVFTTLLAQSSVYEIKGKNTQFYLGGSIHPLREQDYPLPQEFEIAFNNSEILILETDLNEMGKPDKAKIMLGYTMLPSDKTLKTLLTEEIYNELETACAKYSISLAQLNNLKPTMAILALSMMELRKIGVTNIGVDKYYLNKALAVKKDLLFLEDVEYQIKLLANMSDGNENEFVKHSLKDLKDNTEMFEEMTTCWRDGTAGIMKDKIEEMKTDHPKLYQSLLVERYNNWIPHFEGYLETKEVEFVVVGALHLYGANGVLQQMKNKGYKVKQLKL